MSLVNSEKTERRGVDISRAEALAARRRDRTPVGAYAYRVVTGKVVTSRLVYLACARHLRDVLDGPARGLRWSVSRVEHVLSFFTDYLRLPSDADKPFKLLPWEAFVVGSLFGWVRADTGNRRFREAFVEVGKGNGKTPVAAGVGLYLTTADGESRPEVYVVAPIEEQAFICWNDAKAMIEANPAAFRGIARCYPSTGRITTHDGWMATTTGESKTKDGWRVHAAICDEVHEHTDGETIKKLRAGFKTREQPLMLEITNSGSDQTSIAWSHHERGRLILEGAVENDEIFAYIAGVDPEDEDTVLTNRDVWIKANPSLGHTIQPSYIQSLIDGATTPQDEALIKRLNFGIWTQAEAPAMNMRGWGRGQSLWDLSELEGEDCWIAADLASKKDLASVSALFRWKDGWRVISRSVVARDSLSELERKMEIPLARWAEAGWLTICEGDRIDTRVIRKIVEQWDEDYSIMRFGYDEWNIGSMIQELQENCGWDDDMCIKVTQSYAGLSWAMKEVQADVAGGRVDAAFDPLLTWQMANITQQEDTNGNIRPIKGASKIKKVDAVVALIMARRVASVDDAMYDDGDDSDGEGAEVIEVEF